MCDIGKKIKIFSWSTKKSLFVFESAEAAIVMFQDAQSTSTYAVRKTWGITLIWNARKNTYDEGFSFR